jgi:GNAT superfamily N-acetyltransferase
MNITLKPVDKANLQQAIEVAVGVFGEEDRDSIREEFKAAVGIEPEKTIVSVECKIQDSSYFLAFNDEGKPVAVTGHYRIEGHESDAWLGWTGVLPEFAGNGTGATLVREAFADAARRRPTETLRIWTTREDKYDTARRLYTRLGFTEESYEPGAHDAARMISVFTKSAAEGAANPSWQGAAYPIDCERYEIPRLNKQKDAAEAPGNDNRAIVPFRRAI